MTVLIAAGHRRADVGAQPHQIAFRQKSLKAFPTAAARRRHQRAAACGRELIDPRPARCARRARGPHKELAYFQDGKPIWSEPRGIDGGYKWPQFSIHRGTLQRFCSMRRSSGWAREHPYQPSPRRWTETENGVRAEFIYKATANRNAITMAHC